MYIYIKFYKSLLCIQLCHAYFRHIVVGNPNYHIYCNPLDHIHVADEEMGIRDIKQPSKMTNPGL